MLPSEGALLRFAGGAALRLPKISHFSARAASADVIRHVTPRLALIMPISALAS